MPNENPLGGRYIELLEGHGFNVIHVPTYDSHPPQLLELVTTIVRIDEIIADGGRVLVSCKGGLGRSGAVTAAYLVYRGWGFYEAVKEVRQKVPGSLENGGQLSIVETYSTLLSAVGADFLKKYSGVLENIEDRVQTGHASKTVQFTLELLNNLFIRGTDSHGAILEALTHFHDQAYRETVVEQLGLKDIQQSGNPIVAFAHELDYLMDGRVVITQYDDQPEALELTLLCRQDCTPIAERAVLNRHLLRSFIEKEVRVGWGNYLDYV